MKHVTRIVAVCGLCAAVSSAGASIALPEGFDLLLDGGDGRSTWSAFANPGSYQTSIRQENGHNIYRIWGQVAHEGFDVGFDVEFDPDPFVSSSFTVINNSGVVSPFTVTVTVPVAPALLAPTTITGSISGTVGDGDGFLDPFGNGATVMTQANGRPYYEALVDGAGVRQLYPAFQQDIAPLALTSDIDTQNFIGEVGPAVTSTIGIRNAFMLTPGDNASFTSTFVVVPAPAGIAAAGLIGLAGLRRRR